MAGELKMQTKTAQALGLHKLTDDDKRRLIGIMQSMGVSIVALESLWILDDDNELWAWKIDSQLADELQARAGRGVTK